MSRSVSPNEGREALGSTRGSSTPAKRLSRALAESVLPGAATDADFAWAAEQVKAEYAQEHTAHYDGVDGDALIARVGESVALRIAKAVAQRYRQNAPPDTQPNLARKAPASPSQARDFVSWRREAEKRMR